MTSIPLAAALTLTAMSAGRASGVIVFGDDGRNLAEPTGSLLTPWNLQAHIVGDHVNYDATPISSSQLIVAAHTAAGTNNQAIFGGITYNIIGQTDIPNSDLRVMTIDTHGGTTVFPTYAQLWNPAVDGSEVGRPLAVFGRGSQRGTAIYTPLAVPAPSTPVKHGTSVTPTAGGVALEAPVPPMPGGLAGWAVGPDDRLASWGENLVDGIVPITMGSTNYGDTLSFSFSSDSTAVANEATLSGGDSGGGLFVLADDGTWKLAGVNFSTDGNWSYGAQGPYFPASIFDARGLYVGSSANHDLVTYDPSPVAADSYATRIASHLAELQTITGLNFEDNAGGFLPEPGVAFAIVSVASLLRRRRRTR